MPIPESVKRALAAKGNRKTDFDRVRAALNHEEPDCVPVWETTIEPEIKQQFMGRPLKGHAEEMEFFKLAGYDAYPVSPTVISVHAKRRQVGKDRGGVKATSYTTSAYNLSEEMGADGYGKDAIACVERAKELLGIPV